MQCQEVMKKPVVVCREHETVDVAARKMAFANIGFLPVCDGTGRVVGTLTDRDIAVRVAAENRLAGETRVGDVMTRELVSCRPSDELSYAERLMAERRKSRILVVEEGLLAGVISIADLARIADVGAVRTIRAVARREVDADR